MTSIFALVASFTYLYSFKKIWCKAYCPSNKFNPKPIVVLVSISLIIHGLSISQTLIFENSLNINLVNILSLIAWLSVAFLLVSNINKPVLMLGMFIFPQAALFTLAPIISTKPHSVPLELGSHIILSITAYSVLTLATAQSILYAIQERSFSQKKIGRIINILPPLQVMEKILIQLVLIGFSFLSLALFTGAFFIDNLFSQHIVHKTFFAITSWLVYAVLIWGHFKRGWRGQKTNRYLIWAYILMFISYIGTNVIILVIYP